MYYSRTDGGVFGDNVKDKFCQFSIYSYLMGIHQKLL